MSRPHSQRPCLHHLQKRHRFIFELVKLYRSQKKNKSSGIVHVLTSTIFYATMTRQEESAFIHYLKREKRHLFR